VVELAKLIEVKFVLNFVGSSINYLHFSVKQIFCSHNTFELFGMRPSQFTLVTKKFYRVCMPTPHGCGGDKDTW